MKISQLIEDFLEYLAIEKNRSPQTVVTYRFYFNRLKAWLKKDIETVDLDINKIRKFRLYLHDYLDEYNNNLSLKTQTYHLIAIRSMLKFAANRDIPCLAPDKIELPQLDPRQVEFLENEELEKLLNNPETTTMSGLRDRALMELMFSTGLRVAEVAGLNREMLNVENGEMRVVGKGRKERIVFISERARYWLAEYFQKRLDEEKAAFVGYRGKGTGNNPSPKVQMQATRLTPRSIDRIIQKHALESGLVKNVTPHTLRHTFATDLLLNGADIRSVQSLLGHSSIQTTQIYTHITDQHLREIHSKFHGQRLDD